MAIGSLAVEVVPSARGFTTTLRSELLPEADALGHEVGNRLQRGAQEGLSGIHIDAHLRDAEARAQIAELEAKVDELSHKRANIAVDVHNQAGVRSWLTSLIAGAVAIAPAFAVAGTGIAAFGLLAIPTLRDVAKYEHDLATGSAKAAQEFRNLTPAEKQMVAGLAQIRTEFRGFSTDLQPEVLKVFLDLLHQAAMILPEVAGVAKAGARGLSEIITDVGHALTDSQAKQFFDFVEKNLPHDAALIGQTAGDLIHLFFSLVEALHPVSGALLSTVDDLAKFLNWLSRTNPVLADAIVLAFAFAKPLRAISELNVVSTLQNLGKAITGVAVASNAEGLKFGWISKITSGAQAAIASASALKAAEFEAAAGNAAFAVSSGGVVTAIGAEEAAFGALTASERASAIAMGALEAVSPVAWAVAGGVAVAGLTILLLKNTSTIDGQVEALRRQDHAAGANQEGFAKLAAQTDLTAASGARLRTQVQSTAPAFERMRIGAAAYSTATGTVNRANAAASASSRNLAHNLDMAQQAFGLTRAQAEQIAGSLPGVAAGFAKGGSAAQQAFQKFTQYVVGTNTAIAASSRLAAEEAILGNSMSTAAQKAAAEKAALDQLVNPMLDMADAAVQAANDHRQLAQALDRSHGALGTHTQAERDATSAATTAARSAEAYSQAILDNGGSASRAAGPLAALRNALQQAGAHGGIAARLIAELNAQIAALHSKAINIDVNIAQHGGATVPGGGGIRIRAGGAGGGVVPGWSPGVDNHVIAVGGGEGILVPEAVQGIGGPRTIQHLNQKYSKGYRSTGLEFAGGGMVDPDFTWARPGGGHGVVSQRSTGMDDIKLYINLTDGAGFQASSATGASAAENVAKEFMKGQHLTVQEIKAAEKDAIKDIRQYYTGPHQAILVGAIRQQSQHLQKLARESERIANKIDSMKQFAAQETQNLKSFSDLSTITGAVDPTTGQAGPVTGSALASGLKSKLATLKKFFHLIGQLKHHKVAKSLIIQVINMGPEEGIQYAEAILSGGAKLIDELNSYEGMINKEEKLIGRRAADIQFGQNISKGFLSGLEKEKKRLDNEMDRLGDRIARELERALEKIAKKGSGNAHAALSADTVSSATSVGGGVHAQPITGGDYHAILSTLRTVSAREMTLMTREQGREIISLLRGEPRKIADLTGPAVADALNGASNTAGRKARANVRG